MNKHRPKNAEKVLIDSLMEMYDRGFNAGIKNIIAVLQNPDCPELVPKNLLIETIESYDKNKDKEKNDTDSTSGKRVEANERP